MESKKISVIVPVYNIEQYLDECIESIVKQTYKNLEIILVDDGSTDNSSNILDRWAKQDSRIIVIHKQNKGQGDSRNCGFANSTGEFISYIDGDDFVDEKYFEILIDAMISDNADMSGCRFYRNNLNTEGFRYPDLNKDYRFVATSEEFMEHLYNDFGVFCVVWGKLYKRDVIVNDMFSQLEVAEDARVMRGIAYRCNKISYLPDALYMYRDRPGSMMTKERVYTLDDQQKRMLWLDEDIAFYKKKNNDRLQALAEKAYCFNIYSDWKFFDKECRDFYKDKYKEALKHMVFSKGNSIASKCKYIAFCAKMIFD